MLVRLLGKLWGNPINNTQLISDFHPTSPFEGVPERQRGRGMLVRLLGKLFINPINIPLRRSARLLGKLSVNPINIPLRRSARLLGKLPPTSPCVASPSLRAAVPLRSGRLVEIDQTVETWSSATSPYAPFTNSKLRLKLAPPTLRTAVSLRNA